MKKVTYSPYGEPVRDCAAEEYARRLVSDVDTIHVSSEIVVHFVRVLIREGVLDHEQVEFEFIENTQKNIITQKADKNGRLSEWPPGFCDWFDHALERLL